MNHTAGIYVCNNCHYAWDNKNYKKTCPYCGSYDTAPQPKGSEEKHKGKGR